LDEVDGLYQGYIDPPDTDLHTITVPAGTYFVYSQLGVGGNVVINGAGRDVTLITGQGSGVMTLSSGTTAAINDLTITNGQATSAAGIFNAGNLTLTNVAVTNNTATTNSGGGIRNFGALTLDRVLVSGNHAEQNAGGIENVDSSGATLTVSDSTFYRNKSLDATDLYAGGAIYNGSTCTVIIKRSTFEGNSAPYGGGIYNNGNVELTNVTFSGNKGTGASAAGGAAIYNNGSTPAQLWLWNVTIANNESTIPAALTNSGNIEVMAHTIVAGNTGGDCNHTGTINPSNEHHNLSGDTSCSSLLTDGSDQTNTDPKLLPLADNGGPTETVALAADSPAIDAGGICMSGGLPLLTDQRGWPRTVDGDVNGTATCDLGAFEAPPPYQLWLPLIKR
jgi:predicted outer membrane repeat protein